MKLKIKFPERFYEEECRAIKIDTGKKRLWATLLDLLLEFDRVCKENGIKYMIDGGTLLGAARHGGFIPWDDDIDVIMLREEYEKLDKIASDKFKAPYFWQTYKTDKDHGRGFARLRNGSTTYIPRFEMVGDKSAYSHNQGVLIDIFICDNVPGNESERIRFFRRLNKLHNDAWIMREQKMRRWSLSVITRLPDLVRKLKYEILTKILGADIVSAKLKALDMEAQYYNANNTPLVSHLTFCSAQGSRQCILFPRYVLEELGEIEFEGYKFPATKHVDEYLSIVYGNWRKHVVASNSPGGIFIDLDNGYEKHLLGAS